MRIKGGRRISHLPIAALLLLVVAVGGTACEPAIDVKQALRVTNVTTGWFDAGILEDGKNKLVPTISFQLMNATTGAIRTVQVNGVFRLVDDEQELGTMFVRAIDYAGLPPGSSTTPIVLRSSLGYTSTEPRLEMLQHRLFKDAKVELFAKHAGQSFVRLGEFPIERQLLTR